jgi:hypothetical protein
MTVFNDCQILLVVTNEFLFLLRRLCTWLVAKDASSVREKCMQVCH